MARGAIGIGMGGLLLVLAGAQTWGGIPFWAGGLTATLGAGVLALSAATWRAERAAATQARQFERSRARSAEITGRLADLKSRAARLHHKIPDPDVLAGLLPLRIRPAAARAREAPALERAARFMTASPAFAAAVAAGPPSARQATAITVGGLTWWVPKAAATDPLGEDRNLGHQNLSYRAIAQTRDAVIGGIMLDLGANLGRMSIPRVILGDVQAAYCAEPDPLNYACLVRNVADNGLTGLVLPDRLAIGARNTTVRLQRARSAGGHRVLDAHARARGDTVEVPCLTLDTWVERLGIDLEQVSFVKLDVQGSELDVLHGARRVLDCHHIAWQIEIDAGVHGGRRPPLAELYAELARHFTHVIDLNRHTAGPRVRPIAALPEALAYLSAPDQVRTDVLCFCLHPGG